MAPSKINSSKPPVNPAHKANALSGPGSISKTTAMSSVEPKKGATKKFNPQHSQIIRQHSQSNGQAPDPDVQYKKSYIKNQLTRLISDCSTKLLEDDILDTSSDNLLSIKKNAKFICSMLAQDPRTNSHLYQGAKIGTDSCPSITRSVEQAIQSVLPNGVDYTTTQIYPKEMLIGMFKNEKCYEIALDQLSSLLDRPQTRVQLLEPSPNIEQVPAIEVSYSDLSEERQTKTTTDISLSKQGTEKTPAIIDVSGVDNSFSQKPPFGIATTSPSFDSDTPPSVTELSLASSSDSEDSQINELNALAEQETPFDVDIQFDQVTNNADLEQTAISVSIEKTNNQKMEFRAMKGMAPNSASSHSDKQLKNLMKVEDKFGQLAYRSARTTSKEAVRKLAAAIAMEAEHSGHQPLTFAITSALDGLTAKLEIFGQAIPLPGVDNEETHFSHLRQAVDDIWKDNKPIEIDFVKNGVKMSRKINKPLILNLVLSTAAHNIKATKKSRAFNKTQFAELAKTRLSTHETKTKNLALGRTSLVQNNSELETVREALFAKYEKEILKTTNGNAIPKLQKTRLLTQHAQRTHNYSLNFALRALRMMKDGEHISAHDSLKECLLNHFLLKELDIVENYQCKSGQDRTPAMLFICQATELMIQSYKTDLYEAAGRNSSNTGKNHEHMLYIKANKLMDSILAYHPDSIEKEPIKEFKSIFTELLNSFCWEPTIHTRGKPHLKINESALSIIDAKHPSTALFTNFDRSKGKLILQPPQEENKRLSTTFESPSAIN